jgi:acyl-CoA synthetase (AMP-forming)/AMP-acid ligase II
VALCEVATPETLLSYCGERLARYKIPATLEILDALPKTTVNKLDKLALKSRWKP